MPVELSKDFLETAGWEDINKAYSVNQGEMNQKRLDILKGEEAQLSSKGITDKSLQGDIKKQSENMVDYGGISKFAGLDVELKPVDSKDVSLKLSKDKPTDMLIDETLSKMSNQELQGLRAKYSDNKELDAYLAPYEHRAHAREDISEHPERALLYAQFLIPGYQAAKAVGLPVGATEKEPTPVSIEQMKQGYIGVAEGFSKYLSKEFSDFIK